MTVVLEHLLIEQLAGGLPRSPHQRNERHESDAELLVLPGSDTLLAVTTDALVEELASGLYADPWLIGWMLVMSNASDLAAVGAEPLGLLLCESLPADTARAWMDALREGIGDAATATGLGILGGDTNTAGTPHLAATAIGLVRGAPPLTRRGARPGDRLYASAPLGAGGAYALGRLAASDGDGFPFRPVARLAEGRLLRGLASACMDTSDGALAALDELMEQNAVGFQLDAPLEAWTDPRAAAAALAAGLPAWTLHAGPHGEFELLFTVPRAREAALDAAATAIGWTPVCLGTATSGPGLSMTIDGARHPLDTRRVRNLFATCGADVRRYVTRLLEIGPQSEPRGSC